MSGFEPACCPGRGACAGCCRGLPQHGWCPGGGGDATDRGCDRVDPEDGLQWGVQGEGPGSPQARDGTSEKGFSEAEVRYSRIIVIGCDVDGV